MKLLFPFPRWCYYCHNYIATEHQSEISCLCQSCFQELEQIRHSGCRFCGIDHVASFCDERWATYIDRFHSIFHYTDPVREWISSLKYSGNLVAGRIFQEYIQAWFFEHRDVMEQLDFVIPVPIHRGRLFRRGFNQTQYLLKKQRELPVERKCIKKLHATPHQAGLSRKQRAMNLADSFHALRDLSEKRVLIFDDVCTTGQTLGEITKLVKQMGAAEIQVLVLCRAVLS